MKRPKQPHIAPENLAELKAPAKEDFDLAANMVEACAKILVDKPSWAQSMALAELLSIWVCSFYVTGANGSNARAQQRFRARMLRDHIGLVRQLVQAEVKERERAIREQLREAGIDVGDDDGSAEA